MKAAIGIAAGLVVVAAGATIAVFMPAGGERAITSFSSSAEDSVERVPSSVANPSGVTVVLLEPQKKPSISALAAKGHTVITELEFAASDPWSEPSPQLRDRLFAQSGLAPFLSSFDHLKKDLLFLRAQETTMERLQKRYPSLPRARLLVLRQLIDGEKGANQ